ncbi:MAG: hypothetical protein RMI91_02735 [Gemmatales bacterium]|nr:hypothetical protein [Gemmatales bacterium]MDW7993544.1 hypothetical protein [Gemmatales bacterium]
MHARRGDRAEYGLYELAVEIVRQLALREVAPAMLEQLEKVLVESDGT